MSTSSSSSPSNPVMTHFRDLRSINRPVQVNVTRAQRERAKRRADELGVLRNSITGGRSNFYGMLGEEVVRDYLGADRCELADTYQYDLLLPPDRKIRKLEVKTKKTSQTRPPSPHFECSVCDHNPNQRADAYVFVRVSTRDPKKAWICGYKRRDIFFEKARYFRKGDVDPSNGYTVHASCYNLNISELDPIHHLRS